MPGEPNGPGYPGSYPPAGSLRVRAELLEEIVGYARAALPHEACGVAGGSPGEVSALHPLANLSASAERFTVDPVEQLEAYRSMIADGLECTAVYHSHPVTPARPSVTDIAEAHDPDVAYVIVSLAAARPCVRAFRIRDGEVAELAIVTD